ncbi:MAG: ParA family protein [Anaerolineaceae bacterium]|nr:ParA family protein [Anaerolineaceae bacterium]
MKIITVANQKGGVGKTTTVISISHQLAMRGYKTLIMDFDPQGQSGSFINIEPAPGIFNFAIGPRIGEAAMSNARLGIKKTGRKNLDILPGDFSTSTVQVIFQTENRPLNFLRDGIKAFAKKDYDFVILDTAPSVGGIQERAIWAADLLLIPSVTDYGSTEGLDKIIETVIELQTGQDWKGLVAGILPTFHDESTRECRSSIELLRERFSEVVLSPVHRATVLKECAAYGKTVWEMSPKHRAAQEYELVVDHLLRR